MARYKGIKIPTYDEAVELMEMNHLQDQANLADKLVVDARDVNIIVCSMADAQEIIKNDGMNGINRKIEEVIKDYADNVMQGSLEMIDSVKDMEKSVNEDPNKAFKNLVTGESAFNPVKDVQPDDVPEDTTTLTDEQVEQISEAAEKAVEKNETLQALREAPSNNGVDERKSEDITEVGEYKKMNVTVDPNTGENKILNSVDGLDDEETFDEMYERISNGDIEFADEDDTISQEEADHIKEMKASELFGSMANDEDLEDISPAVIQQMIDLANRRKNKENFSVYNSMPDEIKKMIDDSARASGFTPMDKRYKEMKHTIANMLLDDFIANVDMERIKHEFNSEIEQLFNKASNEIGEEIVGYSNEKIAKYKEAADKMEDTEKKQKLLDVLARIQEAYDLNELKEFAKKCKIKHFDLEKPSRHFDAYTRKYANSSYNIYSIEMARPIMYRNLNTGEKEMYSDKDINAFFIAFCKQTMNMKPENVLDHSYMYYVMYNIVLADLNKSEKTRETSEIFMSHVKDVIKNLRKRNQNVL